MSLDNESKTLISPATTPGAAPNGNIIKSVVASTAKRSRLHYFDDIYPPYFIINISIIEILCFLLVPSDLELQLRFEPLNQNQVWRFVTYMLVHESWKHLLQNITMQCLFGIILEGIEGSIKVMMVYVGGGIGGALGAACIRSDILVGASAGIYALLISYISYFILSFQTTRYRLWKYTSITVLIISDIVYNVFHSYGSKLPTISWGAHIFGGVTGFLLGLLFYTHNYDNKGISKALYYTSAILLLILFMVLLYLNVQNRRCNLNKRFIQFNIYC